MKGLLFILALLLPMVGMAEEGVSAIRQPGRSYTEYIRPTPRASESWKKAIDVAVKYRGASLRKVTEWESVEVMNERFKRIRDLRFLRERDRPDFLRRISWLYPDDGCYARSQLSNLNFADWEIPVPDKVFAFGDLAVDTPNSPHGSVSWWYHVAPIVQVQGVKYVLDPAIEPTRPLTLDEWLERQNSEPGEVKVSICRSGTYSPYSVCSRRIMETQTSALRDQIRLLGYEWERLEELGRDPERELGHEPPW